jgi:hypothetical protein
MSEHAVKPSFKFKSMFVSYLHNLILSVQACVSDGCSLKDVVE